MISVRWILKGCPRCRGDLYSEDGGFTCLQCGHHVEVKHEPDKRARRLPVGAARRA
jgi:uncharacterized Zn finger protein (UPF0148 family)